MFDKQLRPWIDKLDGLQRMRTNMYQEVFLYEQARLEQTSQLKSRTKCEAHRQQRIQLQTANEILTHHTRSPAEVRTAIEDMVEFEAVQQEIEERLNRRMEEREQLKSQHQKQGKWHPADVNIPEPKMDWKTTRKVRQLQAKRNKILIHIEEEQKRLNPKAYPKRLY